MIVTFYSYKGGVGRSMALVNVGEILADWGYRVLLCDWDLEAPGLERYLLEHESTLFNDPAGREAYENELTLALGQRGLMDLLIEYKTVLTQPPIPPVEAERDQFASLGKLFLRRPSSFARDVSLSRRSGALMLLSAGRREGSLFQKYAQAVREFDWAEFYEKWGGSSYIEFFRHDLCSGDHSSSIEPVADIVLVDSRTGVTEQGGVCTHHLADVVVLVTAPNEANIEGTHWMASSLVKTNALGMRGDRPPLQILPVESRVEITTEKELLYDFHEYFKGKLREFLPPAIEEKDEFLSAARIPYLGFYSFRERIVAREQRKSLELYKSYQRLADGIVRCGVAEQLVDDRVPRDIAFRRSLSRGTRTPRPQGAIYLCHAPEDLALSSALASGLRGIGVDVWADFSPGPPGWSVEGSAGLLMVVGARGLTSPLRAELDAAVRLLARRTHPIVIVNDADSASSVPPRGVRVPTITAPAGLTPNDRTFFERLAIELATAQPADLGKESPFRGAQATELDARFFFGRDRELGEILTLLDDHPYRWLHITGDSGSGKSAFVRAGLIPAIRRGLVNNLPRESFVAFCTVASDGLLDLASAFFTAEAGLGRRLNEIREQLARGRHALHDFIAEVTAHARPLVLVVDGLETELRRPGPSPLIEALRYCLSEGDLPLLLITTVRSDAEPLRKGRLDFRAAVYALEPMKDAQLREAIEGPVKVAGGRFESGMLDRMIDDCRAAAQPLRLLRRLLDRMWEQGGGLVLTHSSYDNAGGLTGILAATAESTYSSLADDEKKVARATLALLAWRAQFGAPVSFDAAVIIATIDGASPPQDVMAKLAEAGLITISRDSVLLGHPSLTNWDRLIEWVELDAHALRRRDELAAAASSWRAAQKPTSGLPYGQYLRYFDDLRPSSIEESEFLQAAKAHEGARMIRLRVALAMVALLAIFVVAWFVRACSSPRKMPAEIRTTISR